MSITGWIKITMKKLTQNQIALLPTLRADFAKKRDAKSQTLVKIIDDFTAGRHTKTDEKIIKTAVMLYQTNAKKERMEREKRSAEYEKKVAEKKAFAREKIILGAVENWAVAHTNTTPFLHLLMAWQNGFISPRDIEFLSTRFKMTRVDKNEYRIERAGMWYTLRDDGDTWQYTNAHGVACRTPKYGVLHTTTDDDNNDRKSEAERLHNLFSDVLDFGK